VVPAVAAFAARSRAVAAGGHHQCTHGLPPAAPELAFIAKGDEVLDWREMVARYPTAQIALQEGGEHALSDFARHIPRISAFLALP